MLKSSGNTGFSMKFANGNTVSVRWGPGNYCHPIHPQGRMASYDAPKKSDTWESEDAEVAAWDSDGNWHNQGSDQVAGYLTPDEVASFIIFVATSKLDTSSPWGSYGDDDEDDDDVEVSDPEQGSLDAVEALQ